MHEFQYNAKHILTGDKVKFNTVKKVPSQDSVIPILLLTKIQE